MSVKTMNNPTPVNGWTPVVGGISLNYLAACELCNYKTPRMFWRYEKPPNAGFGFTRMRCEKCATVHPA